MPELEGDPEIPEISGDLESRDDIGGAGDDSDVPEGAGEYDDVDLDEAG